MNTVLSWHKGGLLDRAPYKMFWEWLPSPHGDDGGLQKGWHPQTETATRHPDASLSYVGEALICYPISWVPAIVFSSHTYSQELPDISGRRNNLWFFHNRSSLRLAGQCGLWFYYDSCPIPSATPMSYCFLPGSSLPPPNLAESNGSAQVAQRTMTLWMMLVNLEPLHEGPDFSVVSWRSR